jgi:delta 1-pyrroline-5-carboxylate dehydrogenase
VQLGNEEHRSCTGAVVGRHPFGGFKMSGGGTKAGGGDRDEFGAKEDQAVNGR